MRISSLALVFVVAFTAGVMHGCGGSSGARAAGPVVDPAPAKWSAHGLRDRRYRVYR